MPNLLGNDFRVYYDSASSWGTPTWAEQKDVGDVGFDRAPTAVEIPKRGTNHKKFKRGRFEQSLTLRVNYDRTNAFVVAIEAALEADTPIHVALADGAIATVGTKYWHAEYCVVGDPLAATLDEGAYFDVELKPHADSVNEPAKVTVAS